MQIAFATSEEAGGTDRLMAETAGRLTVLGLRLAGAVQVNSQPARGGRYHMDLSLLPSGEVIRISQSLGNLAKGCRLDPGAIARAAGLVEAGVAKGADVLIVNKFGKHEAEGRGFRDAIARALDLGVPVLVGLAASNRAAFEEFTGGVAQALAPEPRALCDWAVRAVRDRPPEAQAS